MRFLIKESTWISQKSAQESVKQSLSLQLLISFHGLDSNCIFRISLTREDGKLIVLVTVLQSNFQTQTSLSGSLFGAHPHSHVEKLEKEMRGIYNLGSTSKSCMKTHKPRCRAFELDWTLNVDAILALLSHYRHSLASK